MENRKRNRYFKIALMGASFLIIALAFGFPNIPYVFYTNETAELYCLNNGSTTQTCLNQSKLFYNDSYRSYGSVGYHNDTGLTVSISDQLNYFNVTGGTAGVLHNCNFTNDYLIVGETGDYLVNWGLGFSGGANDLYEVTILIDGKEQNPCETHRKLGAGGDQGSASSTCIVSLTAGEGVNIGIQNEDSTADPIIYAGGLTINKIN